MMQNARFCVAITLVAAMLLTACQQPTQRVRPTAAPDAWQLAQTPGAPVSKPEKSALKDVISNNAAPLLQALSVVPDSVEAVSFTDWARVKTSFGLDPVAKADLAKFAAQIKEKTPFAIFGLQYIDTHANDWGWNTADLLWEAATRVGDNPVYLLKLRDDFDLSAIESKLDAHKFTKFDYQGATVYQHPTGTQDYDKTTQRAINVTAILPIEKLLVLSYQAKSVQTILDVNATGTPGLVTNTAIGTLAQQLGASDSAMLARAALTCRKLDTLISEQGVSGETLKKVQAAYAGQTVHAYDALGVGYQIGAGKTTGQIYMTYAKADDAKADLPVRQSNLETGLSLSAQQPYSAFFKLDKAELAGDNQLQFIVTPADNLPKNLWTVFSRLDLAFARCP